MLTVSFLAPAHDLRKKYLLHSSSLNLRRSVSMHKLICCHKPRIYKDNIITVKGRRGYEMRMDLTVIALEIQLFKMLNYLTFCIVENISEAYFSGNELWIEKITRKYNYFISRRWLRLMLKFNILSAKNRTTTYKLITKNIRRTTNCFYVNSLPHNNPKYSHKFLNTVNIIRVVLCAGMHSSAWITLVGDSN